MTAEKILAKLAAGDKLREAATPGEWQENFAHWGRSDITAPRPGGTCDLTINGIPNERVCPEIGPRDAAHIVNAHNTHAPMSNALRVAVRALFHIANDNQVDGSGTCEGCARDSINQDYCDTWCPGRRSREALASIASELGVEP